jgi:hypothetical protein
MADTKTEQHDFNWIFGQSDNQYLVPFSSCLSILRLLRKGSIMTAKKRGSSEDYLSASYLLIITKYISSFEPVDHKRYFFI